MCILSLQASKVKKPVTQSQLTDGAKPILAPKATTAVGGAVQEPRHLPGSLFLPPPPLFSFLLNLLQLSHQIQRLVHPHNLKKTMWRHQN